MKIISIKTDTIVAEVGLWDDSKLIIDEKWEAHRQLADTIHIKLREVLEHNKLGWSDIAGVVVYRGPGSFTGLRIGMSVANALAYSLNIPIVATNGENWQLVGIENLLSGANERIVLPEYGAEPNITAPKK